MKVDLVYCVHNRKLFTELSFQSIIANTNWDLVARLLVFDDMSIDGVSQWIDVAIKSMLPHGLMRGYIREEFGGPVAIMKRYLIAYETRPASTHFVKLDNDVVVPPRWLDDVIEHNRCFPEIDLLGIEPPASREACAPWFAREVPYPEYSTGNFPALCDAIGGIGLMRRSAFERRAEMKPFATYGGFTNWQTENPSILKAWIKPPLQVFLLDRVPGLEPVSKHYIAQGWQRPWTMYKVKQFRLWSWFFVAGVADRANRELIDLLKNAS